MNKPQSNQQISSVELKEYLNILLKRKWIVLFTALIIIIAGTIFTLMQKSIYRATARIDVFVGVRTPLNDIYKDYHLSSGQAEILDGDEIKRRVIQKAGPWSDSIPAGDINPSVTVKSVKVSTMIDIFVDSPHKEYAKWYAQNMIDEYIAFKKEQRAESSENAMGNLMTEIDKANNKLKKAEAELSDFRKENEDVLDGEYEFLTTQHITNLSAKVSELRTRQKLLKRQIEELANSDNPSFWVSVIDDLSRIDQQGSLSSEGLISVGESKTPLSTNKDLAESRNSRSQTNQSAPFFVILEEGGAKRWQRLKNEYQALKSELAKINNTYKPQHPYRKKLENELAALVEEMDLELKSLLDNFREKEKSLEVEIAVWEERIKEEQKSFALASSKAMQLQALKDETVRLQNLYDVLMKRANEIEVATDSVLENVSIIEEPRLLPQPIKPNRLRNIIMVIVFGLGTGCGIAFFLDYIDDSIRSKKELKEYTGITGLGVIHSVDWDQKDLSVHKLTLLKENDVIEAYRSIRTNILMSSPETSLKSILVTSAFPSEGKTTTAVNISIILAQAGLRVLLVDADLRRPTIHKMFNRENKRGFSSILAGRNLFEDCVQTAGINGLDLLTAGDVVPDPPKLFHLAKTKEFLEYLCTKYDRIIIDSAPVLTVTDTISLSNWINGIIFVVQGAKTSRTAVVDAKEILLDNSDKIIGAVINNLPLKESIYYSKYYYKYRYDNAKKEYVSANR